MNTGAMRSLSRRFAGLVAGLTVLLSACAGAGGPSPLPAAAPHGEPVALLIQGYNYTDDYIESFTVNGQGGGNIFESGAESGGGGGVCCASYTPGTPLPVRLKIRWTASYCLYRDMTPYGPTSVHPKGLWKEAEVWIEEPPASKPRALEIHFFPDGHLEAAITDGFSSPRMKRPLDERGRRPGAAHDYPWCTDEQHPRR